VGLERGPLSLLSTTEELLYRKVAAPVYKTENTAVGIRHADHVAPSIRKVGTKFVDKLLSFVGIVLSQNQATEFSLVFLCGYEKKCYIFSVKGKLNNANS
jgi:hypothetical protein